MLPRPVRPVRAGATVPTVGPVPATDTHADPPLRVFLVDDHEVARIGVRRLLVESGGIAVVGEAATAAEAVAGLEALLPDVAVLDARLPDGTGIEVCREVRGRHPEVRALILTSYDDPRALLSAVVAGAAGYVLKQVHGNDLVEQIRRVGRGEVVLDPAEVDRARADVEARRHLSDARASLTRQESRVFDLVAQGLSNLEIAHELDLSEKTVRNYVSHLLAKLYVTTRTQAALAAHLLDDPDDGPR